MTHPADLPDLLAAVATGDQHAFERLFRAWYPRLVRSAVLVAGDSDRAEDAVQEAFVGLWRQRNALPDPPKFAGYMHRAVRNRCLNQLRGREMLSLDSASVPPLAVAPTAPLELHEETLAGYVDAALAALPTRTREVFNLSRDEGMTYREIAESLEISVKTVETLMGRALATLRTTLLPRLVNPDSGAESG